MELARSMRVSQQKRFATPSAKIDFEYVADNWAKTHPYISPWFGSSAKAEIAELRVYCKRCDEELKFQDMHDRPKRYFYCQQVKDAYGWVETGCGDKWEQHQLNAMTKSQLEAAFYTVPHVTGEQISVIDTGTDGVKKFGFTRPAREEELVRYYHKALFWRRDKLKEERK